MFYKSIYLPFMLLTLFVLEQVWSERLQTFTLFTDTGQSENYTTNVVDLEAVSNIVRSDELTSVCSQRGVWAFFSAKDFADKYAYGYHPATPDWTCNSRRIGADHGFAAVNSIRHLGSADLDVSALSLYKEPYFASDELYFDGQIISLSISYTFYSFGFTGNDSWTVFNNTNFSGESICLRPNMSDHSDVTYNTQTFLTVGSIVKGCYRTPRLLPIGKVFRQENEGQNSSEAGKPQYNCLELQDALNTSVLFISGNELRLPEPEPFDSFTIQKNSTWTIFTGRDLDGDSMCLEYNASLRNTTTEAVNFKFISSPFLVGSIRKGCDPSMKSGTEKSTLKNAWSTQNPNLNDPAGTDSTPHNIQTSTTTTNQIQKIDATNPTPSERTTSRFSTMNPFTPTSPEHDSTRSLPVGQSTESVQISNLTGRANDFATSSPTSIKDNSRASTSRNPLTSTVANNKTPVPTGLTTQILNTTETDNFASGTPTSTLDNSAATITNQYEFAQTRSTIPSNTGETDDDYDYSQTIYQNPSNLKTTAMTTAIYLINSTNDDWRTSADRNTFTDTSQRSNYYATDWYSSTIATDETTERLTTLSEVSNSELKKGLSSNPWSSNPETRLTSSPTRKAKQLGQHDDEEITTLPYSDYYDYTTSPDAEMTTFANADRTNSTATLTGSSTMSMSTSTEAALNGFGYSNITTSGSNLTTNGNRTASLKINESEKEELISDAGSGTLLFTAFLIVLGILILCMLITLGLFVYFRVTRHRTEIPA